MTSTRSALPRLPVRIALLALGLCATAAHAQWSTDAADNLVVADRTGGQSQPKLVPTADGGFYVSWFGNIGDGFDVYLQRLDAGGNEQWAHDGVLLADRGESSTQDYGLDVDGAGNAVLAYQFEDGGGTPQVAVSKVAPDGTPLWGTPGVIVSADPDGANSPRVAATSDGNVVVAWSAGDGSLVAQKVDPDGNPLWGTTGAVFTPPSGFFLIADLRASDAGSAIVSWSAQMSFSDRELWTQKLAALDGAPLWGVQPVKVFDGSGGAMQLGYFPDFIDDGDGGAVFVWYTVSLNGSVHAQHILADGGAAFAQNGVDLTTDTTRTHTEPAGAYDAASGDIYAIWRVADASTQTQIGLDSQRIDQGGARMWGNHGLVLVPQGGTDRSQVQAVAFDGGALFSWASDDYPQPMPITVTRLDASGAAVWPGETVTIKSAPTDVARTGAALSTAGFAAWVWEDATDGGGGGSIRAQNLNADGSLGVEIDDTVFADGFDG
jgi:hypothetical protein